MVLQLIPMLTTTNFYRKKLYDFCTRTGIAKKGTFKLFQVNIFFQERHGWKKYEGKAQKDNSVQ